MTFLDTSPGRRVHHDHRQPLGAKDVVPPHKELDLQPDRKIELGLLGSHFRHASKPLHCSHFKPTAANPNAQLHSVVL
jgi:hypothetical protein